MTKEFEMVFVRSKFSYWILIFQSDSIEFYEHYRLQISASQKWSDHDFSKWYGGGTQMMILMKISKIRKTLRTVVKQSLIVSWISLKCQLSKNWQNKIWPQMAISTRFGSFGQIPMPQNNPIKLQLFRFPNF